ncbi:hypothetical protein ACFLXO_02200 [Chloroflexota bacterium]
MRKIVYVLLVIIWLTSIGGCDSIKSMSTTVPEGYTAVKTTSISVVNHIIAGTVLSVKIIPPKYAEAGKTYPVELYEKGKLRARTKVTWSQPELNVDYERELFFPLSYEEQTAYRGKDLSNLFSVVVGKMPLE